MKKTLIALAALASMAGVAHAQSTVTIYGLLDANFGGYKTNQVSSGTVQSLRQTKIDSGGLNGSRWGIRVSEDVGGGMAVIGNLESGVNLDNGTSGQGALFGRRANVGLSGSFGKVELGRNSSPYDDVSADYAMMSSGSYSSVFDPAGQNNGLSVAQAAALGTSSGLSFTPTILNPVPTAAQLNDQTVSNNAVFLNHNTSGNGAQNSWIGFQTRFNNSVKYTSPNFSGFSGAFLYSLGEDKTTAVSASKSISANLKYANGPLVVSGAYQTEGGTRTANLSPALQNALISVAYDFGMAKVGFGANRAKYKDVIYAPTGRELAKQNEYSLSVAVPFGATTFSAGYAQSKGDDLGKSKGFGLQAVYALSKRTSLYAGAVSTKNFDKLSDATKTLAPTSNIERTSIYAAGIRHTF